MPTRLIALNGGPDITLLDHIPVMMGRDPRCDARLDSLRISRFHCCVAQIEDGVHVSDLGSTNGTRINGRCVKSGASAKGTSSRSLISDSAWKEATLDQTDDRTTNLLHRPDSR